MEVGYTRTGWRFGQLAIVAVLGSLALGACNQAEDEPPVTLVSLAFHKEPADTAVLQSGLAGSPIFHADPMVLVDGEGYHLFHSSLFCRKSGGYYFSWDPADPAGCDILDTVGALAYAFSGDKGLTWTHRTTPLFLPGPEWDNHAVETAFAARVDDTLYLFYSGVGQRNGTSFNSRYQIGGARLDLAGTSLRTALLDQDRDLVRHRDPVLPFDLRPGRFDNNTQEPSVVWNGVSFELFFIGIGLKHPNEDLVFPEQSIEAIGLGRAIIDRDFRVLARPNSPLLGGPLSPDSIARTPNITEVRVVDGVYHLFSTTLEIGGGKFHQGERLNHFTSPDGVRWSDPEILLTGGATFDNWGIMAPTVVAEPDRLVMFYTAWQITNSPCFPVPPGGRFGSNAASSTKCVFGNVGRAIAPRN
jgi:hypothetical protein